MPRAGHTSGDQRPDPEALLSQAKREGRGRLTVFLGAAAGVGKTYAMLGNARERLAEGLDVVAGLVETHGREETQALLAGVPTVEPRTLEYRGQQMKEMDLDGILRKRPALALIDELAHTNVSGSRHPKRYQDVLEILAAGIDVYTTLNIQHIESLNDVVTRVTGVVVRETVPDSIVEEADEVGLIDIPIEKLLARLKEGKVYTPAQAERAMRSFFRSGNLNALRELALRWTMEHVDKQLNSYMHTHLIEGPWPARERILVAIGPSASGAEVVRVAKRMATSLSAPWLVVHVETPSSGTLDDKAHGSLAATEALAEELGAEVLNITAATVAQGLLALAKERNVTQIVMAKPRRPAWLELIHGSIVEQVLRHSEGIAIHVVPEKEGEPKGHAAEVLSLTPPTRVNAVRLGELALAIAGLTMVLGPSRHALEPANIALLYLIPVLLSASSWGFGYAMFAAVVGVVCFDFFFVPPIGRFTVADTQYVLSFGVFLGLAAMTSRLADRLKDQMRAVRRRQDQLSILHKVSRNVAAVASIEDILAVICKHLTERFLPSLIMLPNSTGDLKVRMQTDPRFALDATGEGIAAWVFGHGESAGFGTGTLPGTDAVFLPLRVEGRTIGVLAVRQPSGHGVIPTDQMSLYKSVADLAATSIERANLTEQAEKAKWLSESDRLYHAIFSSVSHELKIPLATMVGAASNLRDRNAKLSDAMREELLDSIEQQGSKMNRLLENLLNMARLESGTLRLSLDWVDVSDLLHGTIDRCRDFLGTRPVVTDVPADTTLMRADAPLLELALANLIDNAAKYATPGTPIDIGVRVTSDRIHISVADHGPGVAEPELQAIFDKFYRGTQGDAQRGGTGLGLSICRGIVEGHGGSVEAHNRAEGGLVVSLTLPVGHREVT